MSLSMPTMSSPLAAKNRVASAPIRPAEPVMTATDIAQPFSGTSEISKYRLKLLAVISQPTKDIIQNSADRAARSPTRSINHRSIVSHVIRDIHRPGLRLRGDHHLASRVHGTSSGQLYQRDTD